MSFTFPTGFDRAESSYYRHHDPDSQTCPGCGNSDCFTEEERDNKTFLVCEFCGYEEEE